MSNFIVSYFFILMRNTCILLLNEQSILKNNRFNTWCSFLNPSNIVIYSLGMMGQSVCWLISNSLNMLYLCSSKSLQAVMSVLYDVVNAGWCHGDIILGS